MGFPKTGFVVWKKVRECKQALTSPKPGSLIIMQKLLSIAKSITIFRITPMDFPSGFFIVGDHPRDIRHDPFAISEKPEE